MQIHYFFLENIAKSGLGGESSQGGGNQRKSRRSKSLWFLFKSIKKNCRFRRIQGGDPTGGVQEGGGEPNQPDSQSVVFP